MTAEIAVLNKSAVVLAADSAVTIGSGTGAKIYNSANKIFEIGRQNPIGLMIYNRMDFMGLPLEVLAKEFRRTRAEKSYETVAQCKDDFFQFLSKEVDRSDLDELGNLASVTYSLLDYLAREFDYDLRDDIEATGKVLKSRFNNILKGVLDREIGKLKGFPKAAGFKQIVLSEAEKDQVTKIGEQVFKNFKLNVTSKGLLNRLVALTIERQALSNLFTGMVFAGFGERELCPTLIHLKIDGILKGKLKKVEQNVVDIGRNGSPAEVLGFAQDDMVQSFVNGVDPMFRQYSSMLLREAVEASAKLVLTPIVKDPKQTAQVLGGLSRNFDQLTFDLSKKADSWVDRNFTQDVKDMVKSMPKEDLANLAESLIEITSLKRKVTRDRETVGGDVDVAVISRSEGLIWVKRKHYFSPELNSRFFDRRNGK